MELKVSMHPELNIFPIEMRAPYWRWGEMCSVLDSGVGGVVMFSTSLCVSCVRLMEGSITWMSFVVF